MGLGFNVKTEQENIDICRFATVYEAITSIMKGLLTVDEMQKMISAIQKYVNAEQEYMRRK